MLQDKESTRPVPRTDMVKVCRFPTLETRQRYLVSLSTPALVPSRWRCAFFTRIFNQFRVSLTPLTIGTGSKQLVHRCGGDIHHICSGPQEENQDMGPYD